MSMIRVIAAVVDEKQLTIYKEDGQTVTILQGDKRLRPILDVITPAILAKKIPVEVDLMEDSVTDTTYRDYEKKTGGLTRFFRVAKSAIKSLLGGNQEEATPVAPQTLGDVPSANVTHDFTDSTNPVVEKAIEEIMANAQPVSHESFKDEDTTNEHSIVAVLETTDGKKTIVPEVQNLKNHMRHAVQNENIKGMESFLARLGKVIHTRDHTVDDVLRFMKRGDLPLSDDGDIIAYKVLTTDGRGKVLKPGEFVDCHSRQVVQKVGSFVRQDEKLIDKNRRNECSTGLHIARRGYLRGFSGDVIVMVKIKPEDVVAVPPREPDKIRVAGYHIVGQIPASEHDILRNNKPMEGTEALKLLTQTIAGDHIEVTEIVNITAAYGGSFDIIPVEGVKVTETVIKEETKITTPVIEPEDPKALTAEKIQPDTVAKTVKAATQTKAQQAMTLFMAGKFDELGAFKKAAKKSWEALGFSGAEEAQIKAALEMSTKTGSPVTNGQPAVKEEGPVKIIDEKGAHPEALDKAVAEQSNERKPPKMEGNRAEIARKFWDQAVGGHKEAWGHLWMHKKQAKQSWEKLGFTKKEIERINVNKPNWV